MLTAHQAEVPSETCRHSPSSHISIVISYVTNDTADWMQQIAGI